jgi:hypothetical protein
MRFVAGRLRLRLASAGDVLAGWRIGAVLVADHHKERTLVAVHNGLDREPEPGGDFARALVPFQDEETDSLAVVSLERELEDRRDKAIAVSL